MSKHWCIEGGDVCWKSANAELRVFTYEMLVDCLNEKDEKISNLEKQLAEKEKRIRKLHLEAQEYYEDAYCNDFQDKAKADFAIKQIQKAWDMFSEEYFANEKMETLGTRFLSRLDQQIQELRG